MDLTSLLEKALTARQALLDPKQQTALRLFNGFYEGYPSLSIDLYAATAIIYNYADVPYDGAAAVRTAQEFLRASLPRLQSILVKVRRGATPFEKNGQLTYGSQPDRKIREHGVWYAINLTMNRDASLYIDTRNLRKWAIETLRGKSVLNTFAYTGSLGIAALAGGASHVIQLDLNRQFLNQAKTSCTLNGFPIVKKDYLALDFFPAISQLKRENQTFDCIFLDAPFFSTTSKGRVDLQQDSTRLINKLRPLVNDGGWLVAINNALFLSGQDYHAELEALCHDGHLTIEELIPVPEDFTGFPSTRAGNPPVDPSPFNHPTKIAVLRVKHR